MEISPQFIKKIIDTKKRITDQLVSYLLYSKYSNVVFMIKSIKTLAIHCLDIRWATEKGCSSQHSLIAMFGKWKENLDKGGEYRDLSKAFDCLQDDLLLAKLNAYGFDYKFIKLVSSFLSSRKYRTKINSHFNKWKHLIIAVTQGSVLGPLIFNICMCDLFLFMSESNVANYVMIQLNMRVKKIYMICKES